MALVATLKQSGAAVVNGTGSWSTASASFAAGSLVVVMAGIVDQGVGGGGNALTVADNLGSPLTYTARVTANNATGGKSGGRSWTAPFAAGGSITFTFDAGALNVNSAYWFVYELTGHDTTTPTGGSGSSASDVNDGSMSVTLSAAPASADITLAMATIDGSATGTVAVTPGASPWVEDGEVGGTTQQGYSQAQQRTTSTSTTVNWVDVRAGTMVTWSSALHAFVVKVSTATPVSDTRVSRNLGLLIR